jgi:hypothetical protein
MFDSCVVVNGSVFDEDSGITAIKCKQENCSVLPGNYYIDEKLNELDISTIERNILDNIMKISQTRGHHIMQLVHCFEKADSRKVLKALDVLEARGFVDIKGNHIYPSINKIQVIKQILGKS